MTGTLLSLIVAIFFGLHAFQTGWQPPFNSPFFLVTSLLLLFMAFLGTGFVWKNVLRTQTKVMGSAQELYMKDGRLQLSMCCLFAFVLFSLYISLAAPISGALFYLWLGGFGAGFDLLRFYLKRSFQYTSVPFLLQMTSRDLEKAVKNKDEAKAFEWLEVAIDACAKATRKQQIRLASTALNGVQMLMESYVMQLARSEMLLTPQNGSSGITFLDKVNSMCIFVSERLIWVFEAAVDERVVPIAENIIGQFGKMSVFFSRHNPDVAAIPISFLEKCSRIAKNAEQYDLLIRISLTLSETSKQLLAYTKERNESFRDLIMTSLGGLEQVVKMIYKQNRDVNVALLMQPFAEIGEFIGSDKMQAFPNRDEVIKEIRRVLTEFQALQVVTKNVETIAPHVAEDSSSSYQQDMPY